MPPKCPGGHFRFDDDGRPIPDSQVMWVTGSRRQQNTTQGKEQGWGAKGGTLALITRMKAGMMLARLDCRAAVAAACLVLAVVPSAQGFSASGAAAAPTMVSAGFSRLALQPRGGGIRRGLLATSMNFDRLDALGGKAGDAGGAGLGRREALAGGLGAVFVALAAPSGVSAELTPFAESALRWRSPPLLLT